MIVHDNALRGCTTLPGVSLLSVLNGEHEDPRKAAKPKSFRPMPESCKSTYGVPYAGGEESIILLSVFKEA